MEFVIGVLIAVVVAGLVKSGISRKPQRHTETEQRRKRRETDEIVTVILPAINHDK